MVELGGFASAVAQLYKGKKVEINTGETRTTLMFAESSIEQKNLIIGTIVNVIGDGIVVECDTRLGIKTILINGWSVVSITEWDVKTCIKDLYVDDEQTHRR